MKKLLALAVVLFSCTGVDGSKRRAADWAQMANIRDVSTISCQSQDSDDNGYVSCTVFRLDHDPVDLECPSWDTCNSECRGLGMARRK